MKRTIAVIAAFAAVIFVTATVITSAEAHAQHTASPTPAPTPTRDLVNDLSDMIGRDVTIHVDQRSIADNAALAGVTRLNGRVITISGELVGVDGAWIRIRREPHVGSPEIAAFNPNHVIAIATRER